MAVVIAIVGMGQIGASIGLALAEHSELVRRIGHDKKLSTAKSAEKLGALDQVKLNLPAAVREADMVLLCLPVDEVRKTMEVIAEDLNPGTVVLDTSPVKTVVADWAKELLPEACHYVGLLPVINPLYINDPGSGIESARADLFRHGMLVIAAPPSIPADVIDLVLGFSRLLGAQTLFADQAELDGLMAATHMLPQLAAAALLNATAGQPGWREARKLAGRSYSGVTLPLVYQDGPGALCEGALLNRENVVRTLDGLIAELRDLRNLIAENESGLLGERLEKAHRDRETWWRQRVAADWLNVDEERPELPSPGEIWQQMLVGIRKRPVKKDQE
ncbi:MAG: prephenate dehydrogenase [Anaerolineales bacterium]|nr:prephenate dehydrogenase [Anaerolineales bacterium]